MNPTIKLFLFLLLTVLIQEILNYWMKAFFIVGIAPALIFGILWNLNNGKYLYSCLTTSSKFNLAKFKLLSFLSIAWVFIYMILLNIYAYPIDNTHPIERMVFFQISAVTFILPLYSLYYNVRFVATLLSSQNKKISKLKIASSILFFPIGILWVQPKIQDVLQD